MKKILIGIMENGEGDFTHCLQSLEKQENCPFEYFIIQNETSFHAHQILYANFTRYKNNYSGFVKIDADMVLNNNNILEKISKILQTGQYGITMGYVDDYLSCLATPALYGFRNDCIFFDVKDPLLHDLQPKYFDKFHYSQEIWAHHMKYCNEFQAFRFGYHRMMKIIQINSYQKILRNLLIEWGILHNIYHKYIEFGDEKRIMAIISAHHFLFAPDDEKQKIMQDYNGDYVKKLFVEFIKNKNIYKDKIMKIWENPLPIIHQIHKYFESPALDSQIFTHNNSETTISEYNPNNYKNIIIKNFM